MPHALRLHRPPALSGIDTAPSQTTDLLPPCPGGLGQEEEVAMFEMLNEEKAAPERRKVLLTKVVVFVVAILVVVGVIYFLTFPGMK